MKQLGDMEIWAFFVLISSIVLILEPRSPVWQSIHISSLAIWMAMKVGSSRADSLCFYNSIRRWKFLTMKVLIRNNWTSNIFFLTCWIGKDCIFFASFVFYIFYNIISVRVQQVQTMPWNPLTVFHSKKDTQHD